MHRSFAIGILLRKPPARTTPMDQLLISRAFLLCTHVHLVTHRNPSSAHVSENASETQIDIRMTFTVLIVSIEQNEEFQESRVHYTLAGIKSLLKIREGGSLTREGGFRNPWNPPLATPLRVDANKCDISSLVRARVVNPWAHVVFDKIPVSSIGPISVKK